MQFEHLLYEKCDHVVTITINRPEVLNAMQPLTCQEMARALLAYLEDDQLRVAVLRGAGERAFCVGADLKYMSNTDNETVILYPSEEMRAVFARCDKPIIASVRGYAVGGGMELAMRCDIILASQDARLGFPEVKQSLIADTGGLYFLPQRVPYHQAMGLILTGELIHADSAFRMGLVTEVVPSDDLENATRRWTEKILECSPLAVRAAKEMVRTLPQQPAEPDLAAIDRLASVRRLRESEDYREGPRAFAEKRKPKWKGR